MPILETRMLETRVETWPDERACAASAAALAGRPGIDDCFIELHGSLGAGKTTFVRHLLRALGVEGKVKSPTYALMEPYRVGLEGRDVDVAHFDFYRFEDPQEWDDAGFREVFADPGLKIVEWPEKAAELLPPCDMAITITPIEAPIGMTTTATTPADAPGDDEAACNVAARFVRFDAMSRVGQGLLP